jgi:hypothetical protein
VLPWQGQIKELDVLGLDVDDLAELLTSRRRRGTAATLLRFDG